MRPRNGIFFARFETLSDGRSFLSLKHACLDLRDSLHAYGFVTSISGNENTKVVLYFRGP